MMQANRALLTLVIVAACGGAPGAEPTPDAGTIAATRVPAIFTDHGIFFHASFGGVTLLVQLDTGAPLAILDPDLALAKGILHELPPPMAPPANVGVTLGEADLGPRPTVFEHLGAFGGEIPELPGEPLAGIAGNAVFSDRVLGVDPRDGELWISDPLDPEVDPPAPERTGAAQVVAVGQKLGYLQVPCAFSDAPAKLCFFDTGAPDSLVFDRYWSQLPHPSDSIVPYEFADAEGTVRDGYYQRAAAATIADRVTVPGEYVLVGDFDWFDAFCTSQISPECVGIVGMHEVAGYHTAIDYRHDRILYYPYTPMPSTTDPFVGFALLLDAPANQLVVHAVVPGSDAAQGGIQPGDVLLAIDGAPVDAATIAWAVPGYIAGTPRMVRSFTLSRAGSAYSIDLAAADLLPPLP